LYKRLEISQSYSYGLNFRAYLLTDEFKQAVKNHKFVGSAKFLVDEVPISLNSDYSDSDYNEFKKKVEASKVVSISESNAVHLLYLDPSDGLAAQYVECIRVHNANAGFHSEPPIVAEDSIIFHVSFVPLSPRDPFAMVTGPAQIVNGAVADDASVKVGSYISTSVPIVARRDPKRDVVLVLPTDHGAVIQSVPAKSKKEVSMEMPVGTVIASFLGWEQFQSATKCNAMNPNSTWQADTSKWCPADGRETPNSLFTRYASSVHVPDLRGMFLRGVNTIDFNPAIQSIPALDPHKKDPVDRPAGDYQSDSVGPHSHSYGPIPSEVNSPGGNAGSGQHWGSYGGHEHDKGNTSDITEPKSTETRPKNVSVFYYVRIN